MRYPSQVLQALLVITFVIVGASAASGQPSDGKRLALVIGNANYRYTTPLQNPVNDATDVAAALEKLGFTVMRGIDLDKSGMDELIRRFADELATARAGLFYYAGHGLQVSGQNYLLPVDARLDTASALDFELIRLDLVQRTMERQSATNVLFLDACRDNPLARNLARSMGTRSASIGRGLAAAESGVGTLISYSTQPGNVALDGEGRNSPFARALVDQLLTSQEDIADILIGVRREVMKATATRQVPWEHSALTDRFYFALQSASATGSPEPASALSYEQHAELAFWSTVRDSRQPSVVRTYLDRYPEGTFAPLARAIIAELEGQAKSTAGTGRPGTTAGTDVAGLAPASPPAASGPFDGNWRVLKISPGCARRPKHEFSIVVHNGRIDMPKIKGSVSDDGMLQLRVEPGDSTVGLFDGRLVGHAGTASFKGIVSGSGTSCTGTATLTRVPVASPVPAGADMPQGPAGDPEALARQLQTELRRVGCYDAAIDGDWGSGSQNALTEFNKRTGQALPTKEPDPRALAAVRGILTPVCVSEPGRPKPAKCRLESLQECVSRKCPTRDCGLRGTGFCAPANRLRICR